MCKIYIGTYMVSGLFDADILVVGWQSGTRPTEKTASLCLIKAERDG